MNTKNEALVEATFPLDTGRHELTVLNNDGPYRHLKMRNPGSFFHWFEILTSPGMLVFSGDMKTFAFRGEDDMLAFFETAGRATPSYLADKCVAPASVQEYSVDEFEKTLRPKVEEFAERRGLSVNEVWDQVVTEVLDVASDTASAVTAAGSVRHDGERVFEEPYELAMTDWDYHYLWCLRGISKAISMYREKLLDVGITDDEVAV